MENILVIVLGHNKTKENKMTKTKLLFALAIATCALAASAGQASAFFHAASYPVKIHAQNKSLAETFVSGTATLACTTVHYYGTEIVTADSSQVKVQPQYVDGFNAGTASTCTAKDAGLEKEPKIKSGQCIFNFHQAKTAFTGQVSIECPAGETIVIETGILGCIIKVPKQLYLPGITYANQAGPPETIDVGAKIFPLKVELNEACKLGGLKEEAKYEGEAKAEAQTSAGVAVGLKAV